MKELLKYIIGYLVGFTIFLFLIPLGLFELSQLELFSDKLLLNNATIRYIISAILFLIGGSFMFWSNLFLLTVGKGGPSEAFGVSVSPQTKKLVTSGPYRYSRNPMVFGAFTLYTAFAVYLNSITILLFLIIFLVPAIIFLKFSEEKRLIKDFGEEYKEYQKKVSMIFPIKRLKK